jgi:hypothetical protein
MLYDYIVIMVWKQSFWPNHVAVVISIVISDRTWAGTCMETSLCGFRERSGCHNSQYD